jgi:hypothetical protein
MLLHFKRVRAARRLDKAGSGLVQVLRRLTVSLRESAIYCHRPLTTR